MNMKPLEVYPIHLYSLNNNQFIKLITQVSKQLIENPIINSSFQTIGGQFINLTGQLSESVAQSNKHCGSELLNAVAVKRSNCYRGLSLFVKSHTYNEDSEISDAAKKVFHTLKKYGVHRLHKAQYSIETDQLKSLFAELSSESMKKTCQKITDLDSWINSLGQAISQYNKVMDKQINNDVKHVTLKTHNLRKEIIPVFCKLIQSIETFAILDINQHYINFVGQLNTTITNLNL